MFLDARGVEDGAQLECDVCIVGGGAAGITLARELSGTDLRVCLLESGGLEPDPGTQGLYDGENRGHDYDLTGSRLRYFGGTTNHWFGWCRPLDDIDFQEREGVPHSGWPLTRSQLDPYYGRAQRVCQLGPLGYDAGSWARATRTTAFPQMPQVESAVFQVSPPTRFGLAYRAQLRRASNVRILLYANVAGIDVSPNGGAVSGVRAATLSGRKFSVRPRQLVLAAGGIENARLLLASNGVERRGIGNRSGLVGRFFADHPHGRESGYMLLRSSRAASFYDVHPDRVRPRAEGVLVTSDEFVRSERLLRCCVVLLPPTTPAPPLSDQAKSVMHDIERKDIRSSRTLHVRTEPAPNPDSRVTLSDEVDRLGVPKVRLDWRLTDLDRRSAQRSIAAIAAELGAAGLARVREPSLTDGRFWDSVGGGSHHLGTTRMHRDPRHGVVDQNCRVHGVANLYVAGSAVFPTAGFANPTLTIVALAIRLADHLKGGPR